MRNPHLRDTASPALRDGNMIAQGEAGSPIRAALARTGEAEAWVGSFLRTAEPVLTGGTLPRGGQPEQSMHSAKELSPSRSCGFVSSRSARKSSGISIFSSSSKSSRHDSPGSRVSPKKCLPLCTTYLKKYLYIPLCLGGENESAPRRPTIPFREQLVTFVTSPGRFSMTPPTPNLYL